MDRMDDKSMEGREGRLDALWVEYRQACPDPDPAPDFMPNLWQKIDQRRTGNARVFRRLAQICVMATVALTLLMGAVLIPRIQAEAFFAGSYADELAAEHINADYTDFLTTGDLR
jgi:hypothetical protein